jgi:Domain of unknown function (DUF4388)
LANLIAWLGVVLGLAMGGGIAFLFFRQRWQTKSSDAQAEGLYLSGTTSDVQPPSAAPASNPCVSPHPETKPDSEAKPGGSEPTPAAAPKKSLADRLRVPTGLQGNLAQVPVHDFLQFLAQGKRTGILEVISGRRHGYIQISRGQIDHAVFRGRAGLNAVFALLGLTDGDFEFFEGEDAGLPTNFEKGEPHEPLEVLDVLLRWENQVKKLGPTEPGAAEP